MPSQVRLVVDPVTGAEVIYSPNRADRVNAFARELPLPEVAVCPFCPSHEDETPAELQRWPADSHRTAWQVRAVPNKYPITTPDANPAGRHELVIESPDHTSCWMTLPTEHLALALHAVLLRVNAMYQDEAIQQVQVFKNVGSRAGASLSHPHIQILGLNYVPMELQQRTARATGFEQQFGYSYQSWLLSHRNFIVKETTHWTALCPPASRMPYEVWLVSNTDGGPGNGDGVLHDLAAIAQFILRGLDAIVPSVSHNIIWHMPRRGEAFTWQRLEIFPRLTTQAGLEWNTGLHINPVLPEAAALHLVSGL
jgi:UDPglucose--hexose-1-phosphate uridylyltransferase